MNKNLLLVLLAVVVAFVGLLFYRTQAPTDTSPLPLDSQPVAIANPASVFCAENGGTSVVRKSPEGEMSDCTFPDGASCEEWALFRGECNVAGVSNTGIYSDGKTEVKVVYRIKSGTAILIAPTLGYENIPLEQAVSASGARYLSTDQIIEFWEHQSEGKLTVEGKEIFVGRVK